VAAGKSWTQLALTVVTVAVGALLAVGLGIYTFVTSMTTTLHPNPEDVRLDDEIQTYVPAFPEKPWPVTLRQLMGHMATTVDYSCFAGAGAFLSTPSDLVRFGLALQAPVVTGAV
jgi:hypothetical protein